MKNGKKQKVAIAVSGGVDSSVAAALLKKQGYDCLGIFMKLYRDSGSEVCRENLCCSAQAYRDARKVGQKLGIPVYTLDYSRPFKQKIVDDFLSQYENGFTPNPCVACNKYIKFGLLLEHAKKLGCDYLATGHYIKIKNQKSKIKKLYQGDDRQKDQSYFLYNLKQSQLKHLMFPLGGYQKSEVRKIAKELKLPVFEKPESQEICFVPEKDHYPFLKRNLKLKPGPIKDVPGKLLGRHEGLPLYTLGQRRGIRVGGTGPYYVVKIDKRSNTLFVSNKAEDKKLLTSKFKINNISWVSGKKPPNTGLTVKVRYQAEPIRAKIIGQTVYLAKPQRAVMPGQSAVFYRKNELLGGGVIMHTK